METATSLLVLSISITAARQLLGTAPCKTLTGAKGGFPEILIVCLFLVFYLLNWPLSNPLTKQYSILNLIDFALLLSNFCACVNWIYRIRYTAQASAEPNSSQAVCI